MPEHCAKATKPQNPYPASLLSQDSSSWAWRSQAETAAMSIRAAGLSGEAHSAVENPCGVLIGRLGRLELGFWVLLSRRKRCYCFICERKGWCENSIAKGSGLGVQLRGVELFITGTAPFLHSPWQVKGCRGTLVKTV